MSEYERRSPVSALLRGARCGPGAPAPAQRFRNDSTGPKDGGATGLKTTRPAAAAPAHKPLCNSSKLSLRTP